MQKLDLLDFLCKGHPNAYVKIDDIYFPTRIELYDFEVIRLSKDKNMFKYHDGLPIIMTLEESQRSAFETLYDFLIYGRLPDFTSLNIVIRVTFTIEFIIFLTSIANDIEISAILRNKHGAIPVDPEVWIKLMDYELNPSYLREYERIRICAYAFIGSKIDERGQHNRIAYEFTRLKEADLPLTCPLFHKAMTFYGISFAQMCVRYEYVKYTGSGGPN